MLGIFDTLETGPHEKLKFLIERRLYSRALECSLSMMSAPKPQSCSLLFPESILELLASMGDLVRPFTIEIIELMHRKQGLAEMDHLTNQLDVRGMAHYW